MTSTKIYNEQKQINHKNFTALGISNNIPTTEPNDTKDYHFMVDGFFGLESRNTLIEFTTKEPQTIETAFNSKWESCNIFN